MILDALLVGSGELKDCIISILSEGGNIKAQWNIDIKAFAIVGWAVVVT